MQISDLSRSDVGQSRVRRKSASHEFQNPSGRRARPELGSHGEEDRGRHKLFYDYNKARGRLHLYVSGEAAETIEKVTERYTKYLRNVPLCDKIHMISFIKNTSRLWPLTSDMN